MINYRQNKKTIDQMFSRYPNGMVRDHRVDTDRNSNAWLMLLDLHQHWKYELINVSLFILKYQHTCKYHCNVLELKSLVFSRFSRSFHHKSSYYQFHRCLRFLFFSFRPKINNRIRTIDEIDFCTWAWIDRKHAAVGDKSPRSERNFRLFESKFSLVADMMSDEKKTRTIYYQKRWKSRKQKQNQQKFCFNFFFVTILFSKQTQHLMNSSTDCSFSSVLHSYE